MVVNGRPLKRMKRRVTADLYDFLTFPSAGDRFSGNFDGPFRSNVRSFLSRHARLPSLFAPAVFPHLLTWQIVFRIGESSGEDATQAANVALDVVEEDVTRSRSVYCDQCRVVGWSGHPVCGKRYHFIIRADSSSIDGYYNRPCTRCGALLHSLDLRCIPTASFITEYFGFSSDLNGVFSSFIQMGLHGPTRWATPDLF